MKTQNALALGALCAALLLPPKPAAALDKEISLMTGEAIGELAVAGRLAVDLHAEFMMSRTYKKDTVLNWYNCGYSGGGRGTKVGGNFGDFGFQVAYQLRDEKYPHAVRIGDVQAARFDGGDFLKGNFEVEKKIAGAQKMALEVWLRCEKPSPNDAVLGWQTWDGKESSAPLLLPEQFKGSDKLRHLVVNCTPETEDWYLDGVKISGGKRAMLIKEGHLMVLGGAAAAKPSFKGDIVVVRLHDDALNEEEIAHNFQGGPMLGTEMHSWWRNEPDKYRVVESEHFRHCVENDRIAKWNDKQRQEFEERVPGMFHLAELVYRTYTERLAMRSSVVSRRPEKRGDGIKYKTPIMPTDGGNYMGADDDFGWSCQFAGFINPHELAHGYDVQTGNMQGNFWETHANFPQTYNGIYQTIPLVISEGPSAPCSGRTYYHDRLMFEHLAQSPEYGPMFIAKLWYDGPTATEASPYPWKTFTELDKDPSTPLGYEWVRMVQRMITWDYTTYAEAPPGKGNTPHGNDGVRTENLYKKVATENDADVRRFARVVLEAVPNQANWWRVPKEEAPQQLGWNICPLKFKPGTVSATLSGYVNPERGSDWRAGFVGVDNDGKPVYGEVFGPGKTQTFQAGANVKELYLVVVAAPSKIMDINMTGDFRSAEHEQFPYKVQLLSATPDDSLVNDTTVVEGAPHANGGGFVAKAAQVEATAYVGPKARVLGNSKVLGRARIEDFAVVRNATVKDDAVVSGHALVYDNATVAGRAKVRDYAVIKAGSTLQGNARVLEHATLASHKTCGDNVVVKGIANVYGGNQSGTAVIDGFYAKGNEITKGKWFTWSWGQGKNPGENDEDFGGLYADFDFETEHPWMARDAFGTTWGYLVGAPQIQFTPDKEIKKSTLARPEGVVPTLDRPQSDEKDFSLRLAGYLLPPETGDYTFFVSGDDEGELWLGEAGTDKADRKICGNPFWAGFRDYNRFPSQKSAPVRLEKGKIYPLSVLHSNAHQGGSLSVSWSKLGADKPTPIPAECLAVTPDGKQPGVRQMVWNGASSLADFVKRPDYPEGVERVGGHALALNGKDQCVELPPDVADFRQVTYSIEFKSAKAASDARLFEFANPNGDTVWLSPSEKGRLVFAIRQGTKTEELSAPAIAPGVWAKVQIVITDGNGTLYVDGKKVAEKALTLAPDSVRATQCSLGGSAKGSHFAGLIDRFTIYSVPVVPTN